MADRLLIFAKFPRFGNVKTRLEAFIGKEACLRLHRALLLDTLDRTANTKEPRTLYLADCTPEEAHKFVRNNSLEDLDVRLQHGQDLGERMLNAYLEVESDSEAVVFLGTDSPTIPLEFIDRAFTVLRRQAVVVGPAEDGGYYLLGLSAKRSDLFTNVPWGSSRVLEETISRLAPEEYTFLPTWYDVDRVRDLMRLRQDLKGPLEGFPERVHQVLDALPSRLDTLPPLS